MSIHSYHYSIKLGLNDPPFESLIMAALRKADSTNSAKLAAAFPHIFDELKARYHAPLGVIPEDGAIDMAALQDQVRQLMEA